MKKANNLIFLMLGFYFCWDIKNLYSQPETNYYYEDYILLSIDISKIKGQKHIKMFKYFFTKDCDTIIFEQPRNPYGMINCFDKSCNLIIGNKYSFYLKKMCYQKTDKISYYDFVKFRYNDCTKIESYKPPNNKSVFRNITYSINNYVQINNELYNLVNIKPCHGPFFRRGREPLLIK